VKYSVAERLNRLVICLTQIVSSDGFIKCLLKLYGLGLSLRALIYKLKIMTSFKKLFGYALLFVATFSLTALSCEDLTEDLTVNVPTEIKRTIQLSTTAAGAFRIVEPVDLASDEFKENREKIKSYTVETVKFDVVDNIANGSANPTGTSVKFDAGQGSSFEVFPESTTLQQQLDEFSPQEIEGIKSIVEDFIIKPVANNANPVMNITFKGNAAAPMDYTITFTMTGTIKATAK
jgi:hypothetical protein